MTKRQWAYALILIVALGGLGVVLALVLMASVQVPPG
jgi:hypothetical protein